jgi:hypothetical protein
LKNRQPDETRKKSIGAAGLIFRSVQINNLQKHRCDKDLADNSSQHEQTINVKINDKASQGRFTGNRWPLSHNGFGRISCSCGFSC